MVLGAADTVLRVISEDVPLRVGVYVDAFNVYYGARSHCGRGTPGWRWLDLGELAVSLINPRVWPGARLERDVARGFTAYGPQRDDLDVFIGGHAVQEAASRGEIRTMVLALKLMEMQLVEEIRGEPPLLLLDDVFSELDGLAVFIAWFLSAPQPS